MDAPLIFDNASFVAVDKPAGALSVPSRIGKDDPRVTVGLWLEERLGTRIFPVHRLDADVSGLLLYAKTPAAHKAANAWFENRIVKKSYEALTEGDASKIDVGVPYEWRSVILRGKKRAYASPHGKEALTRATLLGALDLHGTRVWRWSLEPLTGRAHQLRFELAKHGFPIVGDQLYGAQSPFVQNGIALRSVEVDFAGCTNASSFGLPPCIRIKGFA